MLVPGTRLGAYEVLGSLGAGGMGEVYRARDTRLQRDVAIKLLPPSATTDAERTARFAREAQVLASLNHPHIGAIYGLEKSDAAEFLVLELVDGETLDSRIARGRIPIDEALPLATQIAEALEAAHDKGIVHRDLKPSNIALTADGQVKVLDFGLAKLVSTGSSTPPSSMSMSPTLTSPALVTGVGSLLGTAAYMSPEQARGKEADRRSDVWAFGCVLFEMLTGRRAFDGEVVSETIANVLKGEPEWTALPADTPPAVRVLLKGCLERNPRQRLGDLSAARLLIAESPYLQQTAAPAAPRRRQKLTFAALGASAALAIGAAGYAFATRGTGPGPVRILELSLPVVFNFGAPASAVLSPDGRRLAYIAPNEQGRLDVLVKDLDGIRVTRVADTNGAHSPFWSPDSVWVAYYDGDRLMRAMPGGGPPETLANRRGQARGGDWNERGDILFTDGVDIKRVSVSDPARSVSAVVSNARFPAFLPDGERFLYNDRESNALLLGSLSGGSPQKVLANTGQTLVSSTGHLLFAREGTLLLAPFDAKQGIVTGDAAALERRVYHMRDTGGTGVSIDRHGTLIMSTLPFNFATLRWHHLDTARVEDVGLEPFAIGAAGLDLSRDGTRAAISRVDAAGQSDVWISELSRPNLSRLTADPRNESNPVWAPDGRSVAFAREDGGTVELLWKAVDRADPERVILSMERSLHPTNWTPDGARIVFSHNDEVWLAPLTGQSAPRRLARGAQGQVSPDGVWLAYASEETGTSEVYVQRLADGSDRRQVSTQGGHMPRWTADGTALAYVRFTGDLMWVAFDLKSGSAGIPAKKLRIPVTTRIAVFRYALSGDRVFVAENSTTAPPYRVVLNWPSLLAQ